MGTLTKFIIIRLQPRRRNSGFDRRSADGRITPARWAAQCELVGVLRAADTQFPASCVPARSRARPANWNTYGIMGDQMKIGTTVPSLPYQTKRNLDFLAADTTLV
ncbi:uncharacterized protein LOC134536980 isoform X3 [Bacillus rossius redtenbacheri]|uniref:uncharacterized protein LOC134536980 isoform X3 n=1 Tax=Bacillus rossius redtenbacheri TaxID=93214 RepID=UPI002FDC9EDA